MGKHIMGKHIMGNTFWVQCIIIICCRVCICHLCLRMVRLLIYYIKCTKNCTNFTAVLPSQGKYVTKLPCYPTFVERVDEL